MTLLSGGDNMIKYLLFIFNFLFVITGIILLSIGLTVQGVFHGYTHFLDDQFFSVPAFLIAIGAIIFFIAFFGCCGAIRENYCMTLTFSILLILIFILELAAGISGYVLRNQTHDLVENTLRGTMEQYVNKTSDDILLLWDEVQANFECCGLHNLSDWQAVHPNEFIPMSCCGPVRGAFDNITCRSDTKGVFNSGCVPIFGDYISAHAVSLGAAGISLAVIQFVGIFFACYLARQIKNKQGHTGF